MFSPERNCVRMFKLPVDPIKTSLLEARVVTAGKGGEGGKVLDNLEYKLMIGGGGRIS